MRALLYALACALASPVSAAAQSAPKETKDPGVVAGRVLMEGRGVAGVLLSLVPAEWADRGKAAPKGKTDAEGRYRLADVPPGRYYLSPFAPALVVAGLSQTSWQPGRLLNIAPGEKLEDLDFALTRGGVITGRVTYADGRPVVETPVRVMAADEAERKKPQYDMSPFAFNTDDRGVYRLYGLARGRYLVFVGESPEDGIVRTGGAGGVVARTFYGNTTDVAQAKPVELATGEEVTAVDISVAKPSRTYEVAGRVVDERGRGVADASCMYGPVSADGRFMGSFGSDGSRTNAQGEFRLKGLPPGRYGLFANQGQPFNNEQNTTFSDAATVEIIDRDVTGIEIKLTRGATLSGVVVLEGTTNPAIIARVAELRLGATAPSRDALVPPISGQTRVNADGSFTMTGLRPGKTTLHMGYPQVRGFVIARVQRDGVDQTDGIDVRPNDQVTGVRVVVTYGASMIRGQVQFPAPGRPDGARVHIEAQRTDTPRGNGWHAEVDALGRFVIENLTAGEYELYLFEEYPAFGTEQRRPPAGRKVVTVPENGEAQVTIVFGQGPPSQ